MPQSSSIHQQEIAMLPSISQFRSSTYLTVVVSGLLLLPAVAHAQHYTQTNLVSDQAGVAAVTDPHLVNPWGLTRSATSPWWVADNNSGVSTLYNGATGAPIEINGTGTVIIPGPKGSPAGFVAAPTGVVFNGSPTDFLVGPSAPAHFIFVTEDGTIFGWNSGPPATLVMDNSDGGSPDGAVYKGATTALVNGHVFLYVTNFRSGRVEVYDTHFKRVRISEELFDDEAIPRGFAPFNIQNVGGTLFVTYARQD